ncbi:MBL fold metallo-hydrolase [Colwellia psychrerythraea]|uniref:Beta-lactamase domain protein n=1 Tax=Colwellia psychrerythraea TaxID=28229 RepID=A0A099KHV5_COLPS|nr:MBL fold metallo-hydrolase [Colwellia psychrerythraea]KGJ89845.1 beta-lactamase domain protein [Colwellia psychrerythraea]
MKKIKLSENLHQYQFSPFEGQHFGFNIYVLIDGNDALLIDTAFEDHAQAVLADLEKSGIEIRQVVFSHFHPDHISGLSALNTPKLFGNGLYQQTLNKYTPIEKHHFFADMNIIDERSVLTFGQFNLRFNLVLGHVPCGMFTIINETFVHVADDIMTSNTGEPLLPSVQFSNAQDHIDSLELLKQYSSYTLLLSHGNAITGEKQILAAIEHRQNYLRAIASSNKPLSIEQALKNCDCDFLQQDWHDYVYR